MIDNETTARPGADPLVGRLLGGRFAIQELVAKGGMGRVYRAEQRPLGRTVAVKVLHLDGRNEDDGGFRERFFREASICARLTHPNTVRVFDYGSEDGTYFIVMEFLEGRTLNDLVRAEGPLQVDRSISLVRQICRSLAQAHSQGVVHRDLKPANIFVTPHGDDEFVKVLDFGLVKSMDNQSQVTRAGNILGSPAYMSPEQVLGLHVGPPADIYAVGVILYACLTRTLPFKRDHPMAVLNAHAHAAPPSFAAAAPGTDLPGHIEWIVMRCLEKDPAQRFASMNELDRALRLCQLELNGNLADFAWRLDEGRLTLPEGMQDSGSLSRTTAPTLATVTDQPSSPTLNLKQQESLGSRPAAESTWSQTQPGEPPAGRPLRDFVIAAVLVMLLSVIGAIALGAAGWFVLQPQGSPKVIAEPQVLPKVEPDALQVAEPLEEPEPEPAEEPQEHAELAPEPAPDRAASSRPKPRARPRAVPAEPEPAEAPPSTADELPSFGELVTTQHAEPVDPAEPPPEDDWGSVKADKDLKDPWAKKTD